MEFLRFEFLALGISRDLLDQTIPDGHGIGSVFNLSTNETGEDGHFSRAHSRSHSD